MQSLSHLPYDFKTRSNSVLLYRSGRYSIKYVTRKYHISKASLLRWNKLYDGTKESLLDKSHRPHKPHPKSHTPLEIKKIKRLIRRNPGIGLTNYSLNFVYPLVTLDTRLVSIVGSKPMATMASLRLTKHLTSPNPIKHLSY